jgi:predicted amidohydrolase
MKGGFIMESYLVACCQMDISLIKDRAQIESRAAAMRDMVINAVEGYRDYLPVKLVVFPEFSLTPITTDRASNLLRDMAIPLRNEYMESFKDLAERYDIKINIGTFLEKSEKYPNAVFNTSVTVDSSGIILVYRKLNPFIPLEPVQSPHDLKNYTEDIFPISETSIGRLATEICYDSRFPEQSRALALKGAEIVMIPSAYMEPWGGVEPMNIWTTILRARAIENNFYVVGCSLGSRYENHPPYSWVGNSIVIDYEGRIVAQSPSGPSNQILVAPINLQGLREFRQRTLLLSFAHLRTEIYRQVYERSVFPSGGLEGSNDLTQEMIRDKIEQVKRSILRFK